MQGILVDAGTRPDIALSNGRLWGGLHCGDCFSCLFADVWISVRLEYLDGWVSQENQGGRYTSEKNIPNSSAKGKQAEPYATFRKMKQAGGHYGKYAGYDSDDAETFCKQALFMKDFTDHYSEIVHLLHHIRKNE